MKRFTVIMLFMAVAAVNAAADGGMWMVNLIDKSLALKMRDAGMKIDPSMIYNETTASFSDAVVFFEQGCTGSVISDEGLVMTTHHCAYPDIVGVSSEDNNYLEDGFWAMTLEEERPIPGKNAMFLKYIIDVTDDVGEYIAETEREGKQINMRRMRFLMEKAVRDETGYKAVLSSMWCGEKYYMSLYEVYPDVRLVAAPGVSIASFGGDVDNWEWPQHKGDFAMYRIYAAPDGSPAEYSPENVPLSPRYSFAISTDGYSEGDFTLIMGYPDATGRYSSSFAVKDDIYRINPITVGMKEDRIRIIRGHMAENPAVRLKYYNTFFSLSNTREYDAGETDNILRHHILDSIASREAVLQAWVSEDPVRIERWGSLMGDLERKYADVAGISDQILYFTGTMIEGTGLYPYVRSMAVRKSRHGDSPKTVQRFADAFHAIGGMWKQLDPKVEKELLEYAVSVFFTHVDEEFRSPFHVYLEETFGNDYSAMTDYIWKNSFFTDKARYDSLSVLVEPVLENARSYEIGSCDEACDVLRERIALYYDPLYQLLRSSRIYEFYAALGRVEDGVTVGMLEDKYARMLYSMRESSGIPQYPDANSTMRFTFGNVSPLSPRDAVYYSWRSTSDGIVQKYSPEKEDFSPDGRFMHLLCSGDWGRWAAADGKMYVDFLTDNDVTRGNSGSPVLDCNGKLIGMAFDANYESLAGGLYYLEDYNKAVCADIRYILWILDKYAGMSRIIEELGL